MGGRVRHRQASEARKRESTPETSTTTVAPAPDAEPRMRRVLDVQRAAGNRAVSRAMVQRWHWPGEGGDLLPWEEGSFGRVGKIVPPAMVVSLLVQKLSEGSMNNAVMTKCIEHYVNGGGSPLNLTAADVHQMWVTADLFGGGGFPKLKSARDELVNEAHQRQDKRQASDPEARQAGFTHPISTTGMSRKVVDDVGSALTHALGTAKMTITGDVSYAEGQGCTFTGTFTLEDRWDFNILGPFTHRGLKNELETIVGRYGLAGAPFTVTTDPVRLEKNQQQGNTIIEESSGSG